jgi:hypothetical protein
MSPSEKFFRSALYAAALALMTAAVCAPARAQIDTGNPIPVKTLKPKLETFKGSVMHMTPVAITVRSSENELAVRTFRYSDKVREQMQQIIDRGGYQFGDKVVIKYETGSNVALRVKGKPSKPI